MSSCCTDKIDLCVIRGDVFELSVGLSAAAVEVVENPADFTANLVFREAQDDNLTPYLTLSSTITVLTEDELPPIPKESEPVAYAYFTATIDETQGLPEWDHVGYCELQGIGTPDLPTGRVKRLFNTEITIND